MKNSTFPYSHIPIPTLEAPGIEWGSTLGVGCFGPRILCTGDDGTVRGSDVSPVIIVLSFFCLLLLTVFVSIFGRKFYKAWSHGAHGRQLFRESFRVN